jgi:hypothetical protein
MAIHFSYTTAIWEIQKKNSYMYMFLSLFQCTYTITVLAPVFTYPVISHIRILHVKCKIIGKVKMETTAMWGLTLIILKDIKCFKIWAYFKGIGINFNFENFQNKIFPQFLTFQGKRIENKPTLDFWQMLQRPVISRMHTLDGS